MAKGEIIPVYSYEEQRTLGSFAASRHGSAFEDLAEHFTADVIGNAFTTDDPNRIRISYGGASHQESLTLPLTELEEAMPKFAARARKVIARSFQN